MYQKIVFVNTYITRNVPTGTRSLRTCQHSVYNLDSRFYDRTPIYFLSLRTMPLRTINDVNDMLASRK